MENLLFGIPLAGLVFLIPGLPLLGALCNGLIAILCRGGEENKKRPVPKALVSVIAILMPLLSFALTVWIFFIAKDPASGITTEPIMRWIQVGDFSADIAFKVDRLSLTLCLIVTGVGTLIHLYSTGYMSHDAGFARYFTYLNLFLFAMLILILAANLPLLFVGWEGVGMCSYFLIGFWFKDPQKAAAGMKAFVVNRIGDFGFLLGMFLIYKYLSDKGLDPTGGFLSFDVLEKYKGDLFLIATPITLCLFIGATGKSAQIPLYVWLPDAMAGPTPVSALIHAATMVTAGIYMICRLHFLFVLSPETMQLIACVGVATALFAALMAIAQSDIKKVLAYSTVSQLGYLFFAVGVGAFSAAIFHLMTHAFFKACLFLGSGSVIHALDGEQNIWKMGGLKKKMPITSFTFGVSVLAIAGIFPFSGFFSKDAILWQGYAMGHHTLWALALLTAGLTAFYMSRLHALVFLGAPRGGKSFLHAHESPLTMTIPLMILAVLAIVGGWVGIPEALKGGDQFFKWFAPLFPYESFYLQLESFSHGQELLFSFITLLISFHLWFIARLLYSQKLNLIEKAYTKLKGLHHILENKFYVDEIYQFVIVRPLLWISKNVLWKFSDEKVVDDLLVNGTAQTVNLFGKTLALLQSGFVQSYALLLATGAIIVIAYFIW